MSERLNVYIDGKLRVGIDEAQALLRIQKMFKVDGEAARKMLNGRRRIVKRNADPETAEKMSAALSKIGFTPFTRAAESSAPASAPKASTPTPPPVPRAPEAPPTPPTPTAPPVPRATAETGPIAWENHGGWEFSIEGKPDFAFINVRIPAGETMQVEASAMATMDSHLVMKTKLGGGFKRFLSGESVFINQFTAEGGPGEIGIAPSIPGDVAHQYLSDTTIYLQNSAFVACTSGVTVETKWQGLAKGFFSGEGLFLIRAVGTGDLWFNTFGALIEQQVDGEYIVDNGHIVAFTEGLEYSMTKLGGLKSFFLSGEGLVCKFKGKGTVWIQTRKAGAFSSWASAFRPVKKRG